MIIEGTGIEGKELTLASLDHVMEELGFIRWAWDYQRATYDYKYVDKKTGNVIYLRVPSHAIDGEIEEGENLSILKLGQPYIGKYIYPHGFDYEFDFPKHILNHAKSILNNLSQHLEQEG